MSVSECQGCNNRNSNSISKDRFYYNNYDGYTLIFDKYYAWISLKEKDKDRDSNCGRRRKRRKRRNKDRDRDREIRGLGRL